jgi:hypothetical protein
MKMSSLRRLERWPLVIYTRYPDGVARRPTTAECVELHFLSSSSRSTPVALLQCGPSTWFRLSLIVNPRASRSVPRMSAPKSAGQSREGCMAAIVPIFIRLNRERPTSHGLPNHAVCFCQSTPRYSTAQDPKIRLPDVCLERLRNLDAVMKC